MSTAKQFIDSDFRDFSNYDNDRNLPDIRDGLKLSQRKAIFGARQVCNRDKIKVAQLASHAAKVTHYAHGEDNLGETIIKMAQTFVGSNNINLFEPLGQFGSILSPESASQRYIHTKLTKNFTELFSKDDDCILNYRNHEGYEIEPECYYPSIPICLLNGSRGIGTGHSTLILSYDKKDLRKAIKAVLNGKKQPKLVPYFDGYTGEVNKEDKQTIFTGKYEIVNTTKIVVTELPPGTISDKYKVVLNKLMDDKVIKDYDNNSKEEGWKFVIHCPREFTKRTHDYIVTTLKLQTKVTENLTLHDVSGKLHRFNTVQEIIEQFTHWRTTQYEVRRRKHIELNNDYLDWLLCKYDFIDVYNSFTAKVDEDVLKQELIDDADIEHDVDKYWERLMSLPVRSLTYIKQRECADEIKSIRKIIRELEKTTAKELYLGEL